MKKRSWPDLCERLLEKLEAAGADTSDERGEPMETLEIKGDVNDGD